MFRYISKMAAVSVISLTAAVTGVQAQDLTSMSWDEIVAQAKEEGEITWYQWYLEPEMREQVKVFEEKYGIKVTIPDGDYGPNFDKLLAERDRETGDIDVVSFGPGSFEQIDLSEIFLGPLPGIIPGAEKLSTTFGIYDGEGYTFAFWGNQAGLGYNPALVDEATLPQTVEELASWMETNPNMLGFNVENGGAGKAFISAVGRKVAPDVDFDDGSDASEKLAALSPLYEFFNAAENGFIITAGNADSVTRLNDGEFGLVATYEDFVAGLQQKGEISDKLKFYVPNFGMPGGHNIVGVPKNAENPAAALVFVHWLTSAETQTEFNKTFGSVPQHPDSSDEFALVPQSQRGNTIPWPADPFGNKMMEGFIENVVQN